MESKDLAQKVANLANDKKAKDILILDMATLSPVTDYYIVCSASNSTLVQAIADNIEDKLAEMEVFPLHKEGYNEAQWILLDFGDVVVHVFLEEERDFYNLEQLWADAPSVDFIEETND